MTFSIIELVLGKNNALCDSFYFLRGLSNFSTLRERSRRAKSILFASVVTGDFRMVMFRFRNNFDTKHDSSSLRF